MAREIHHEHIARAVERDRSGITEVDAHDHRHASCGDVAPLHSVVINNVKVSRSIDRNAPRVMNVGDSQSGHLPCRRRPYVDRIVEWIRDVEIACRICGENGVDRLSDRDDRSRSGAGERGLVDDAVTREEEIAGAIDGKS